MFYLTSAQVEALKVIDKHGASGISNRTSMGHNVIHWGTAQALARFDMPEAPCLSITLSAST